jgi:hypothetical protein
MLLWSHTDICCNTLTCCVVGPARATATSDTSGKHRPSFWGVRLASEYAADQLLSAGDLT